MTNTDRKRDALRLLLQTARAFNDPIELSSPGGVAGLQTLASKLEVTTNHRETLNAPSVTLRNGGGDWDDVVCLLACAAKRSGLATRICFDGSVLQLQARVNESDRWEPVGSRGSFGRPMARGTEEG